MVRLYITRHGETEWNKSRRFQGHKNSALTDKGVLGAKLLSQRFSDIEVDAIISSPLLRAYETAQIVRGDKPVSIITDDGLKEINLGDFEGMTYGEIEGKYKSALRKIEDNPYDNCYPNGENLLGFYDRVVKAVENIIKNYENKSLLIVAHGGTVKCIECWFRGVSIHKDWMSSVVENCSLTCVEVEDGSIREVFYNDTEHLRSDPSYDVRQWKLWDE